MAPVSVVLAAGKSTRMKSALPKVLHEVCGRPMIEYVLDAAREAGVARHVVIVGYGAQKVKDSLAGSPGVEFTLQAEQKGTGHAVMMCRDNLRDHDGPVLVLTGDAPLMRPQSLRALLDEFSAQQATCVIGTAETEFNQGLGRIVRSPTLIRCSDRMCGVPAGRHMGTRATRLGPTLRAPGRAPAQT